MRAESAMPSACLAMVVAVAGATRTRSAQRASEVCGTSGGAGSGKSSLSTGWPVSVENVISPTNRRADGDMTTRTSAPARMSSRASSTDL